MKKYIAEPFGTEIFMYDNEKDFCSAYRRFTKDSPDVPLYADGITCQLENEDGMILVIGWFDPWWYSTLAHECSHAAFRVCGRHGVVLDYNNNEVHAYLLSHMMDRFLGVR